MQGTASGRGARVVATKNLKLSIALGALQEKITKGGTLRMGFLENARYPETTNERFLKAVGSKATPKVMPNISVAQAMFWNEFGTQTAPARPVFRTTIKKESPEWGDKLGKAIVAMDYDGEKALRLLGQAMRDDLENAIAQWDTPGNAPLTIKIKGFDAPLRDSGVAQRAPDYEVVK